MSKKIIKTVAAGALLAALLGAPLLAQPTGGVADTRKATMKEISSAAGVIRTQGRADAPDMAAVKAAAATLTADAAKLYTLFPAGSGAPAGMPGAKPEIWTMPVEFKAAQDNFANAVKAIAAAGDATAFKAAAGTIGQTCQGCHMTFRAQAPRQAPPAAAPAPAPAS